MPQLLLVVATRPPGLEHRAGTQPRRWLLAGRLRLVNGSMRGADRSWQRGLALAERFGMPREAARLHAELGARAGDGSERRRFDMDAARAIYIRMGCAMRAARLAADQ